MNSNAQHDYRVLVSVNAETGAPHRAFDVTNYVRAAATKHFIIYYDEQLSAVGKSLADHAAADCESDYGTLRCQFVGVTPARLPFSVYINPGRGGASHQTCFGTSLFCDAFGGVEPDLVSNFIVAEADEVFMATMNNGWNCGYSNGEGLSRVLATELHPSSMDHGFASGASWLDSSNPRRPDWVSSTDPSDVHYISIGCSTLFLNYLRYQLDYTWEQIIRAGGTTLESTYRALTGKTGGFSPFFDLLATHYPGPHSGLKNDNPFPLAK